MDSDGRLWVILSKQLSMKMGAKTVKTDYFFNSILLNRFLIATILITSSLSSKVVLAQSEPKPESNFSNLPAPLYPQDEAVTKAITQAGPIADAARTLGITTHEILKSMNDSNGQDPKFFFTATVGSIRAGSIADSKAAGNLRQGDRILVGITQKQINEQLLAIRNYTVMGMTEEQALAQSGQGPVTPGSETRACDNNHNQGDIANRWCHAAIVDSVNQYLLLMGVNPVLSAVLGSLPIFFKEYVVDSHPSKSDMVVGEIQIFTFNKAKPKDGSISVTGFADGAVFLTYRGKFRGL